MIALAPNISKSLFTDLEELPQLLKILGMTRMTFSFYCIWESVHDSDCDCDSDDEFTNKQKVEFLSNLVVEHEKLIKSYLKYHDILEGHKNKIDMLNIEKTNLHEKFRFLKSEHHSLLEKNNVLT